MSFLFRAFYAAAFVLAGAFVVPAPVGAQTLNDALVSAYMNNPQFQADHARQRALDEDVARASGGFRPSAQINGQIGRGKSDLYYDYLHPPLHTPARISPQSVGVQIVQPIYDGGKASADVARSKSNVKGGRSHSVAVEQSVLGEATQAYYDLYRDQAILEFAKTDVVWLDDEVKATSALFKKQQVTRTDVAQADARRARGVATKVNAEGAVGSSESAFVKATGLTPGILPPPPPPPVDLLPASLQEAMALALQSPSVLEADQAIESAQSDVDYVSSAVKPSLSVQLSSQYSSETSQGQFRQRQSQAVASLVIPLYNGGSDHARIREAKTILSQRKFEADDARRQAIDRVKKTWEELTSNRARIEFLKQQVKSTDIARTSIITERSVGTRTTIDQLNAEQDWLDAQIGLAQAQHDEAINTYAVLNAIGRLTARTLKLPVPLYDPNENYRKESGRWFGFGIPKEDDELFHSAIP